MGVLHWTKLTDEGTPKCIEQWGVDATLSSYRFSYPLGVHFNICSAPKWDWENGLLTDERYYLLLGHVYITDGLRFIDYRQTEFSSLKAAQDAAEAWLVRMDVTGEI